ncbi:MAG: hypothetical protein LBT41_02205 [Candidatus Methanoplasma sp.]|jgi:uncharacterized membrane protein YjdF|nr:hypothetical protein [Candidatus Methanoplasma sp.]
MGKFATIFARIAPVIFIFNGILQLRKANWELTQDILVYFVTVAIVILAIEAAYIFTLKHEKDKPQTD